MDFTELQSKHNIIFICKFGSHLYGTDTETSDTDYKGIYIPSLDDCILNRIPKSLNLDTNKTDEKNSVNDIDCEIYSIQHFMELLRRGETVAIDMIHCNAENTVVTTPQFQYLQKIRSHFYTTDMKALVGYARRQAAKYGMKGSRIAAAKKLQEYLLQFDIDTRLTKYWDNMPKGEYLGDVETVSGKVREYAFCGKRIQETVKVGYALKMVKNFLSSYGERARLAEQNKGVDWKALSHAIRAAMQLEEIYRTGDLIFPLQGRHTLKLVKQGQLDFKTTIALLENTISQVEQLAKEITLPAEVEQSYVDGVIRMLY